MNMFVRKAKTTSSQAAVDELNRKKLYTKILDTKKEFNSRLRYLKNLIDLSTEQNQLNELKQFFDQNYNQIYFIFYESFVLVESNLKQKLNKLNKEELDIVLFIFQKILTLQPEKINQRWQVRSIGRLLQKLLHIGNAKIVKLSGLRLFLLWYQILNKNRTNTEELMFQKLIQGFDLFHSSVPVLNSSIGFDLLNAEAQKVFSNAHNHEQQNQTSLNQFLSINQTRSTIYQYEISYLIPATINNDQSSINSTQQAQQLNQQNLNTPQLQSTQINPQSGLGSSQIQDENQSQPLATQSNQTQANSNNIYNLTADLLKHMLEFMEHDCLSIEWSGDKLKQAVYCYEFLFDEFKRFYLSYMFPNAFLIQSKSSSNLVNLTNSLNVYSNLDFLSLINNDVGSQNQASQTNNNTNNSTNVNSNNINLIMDRHQIQNDEKKLTQLNCKEEIIKWLIKVLLIDFNNNNNNNNNNNSNSNNNNNVNYNNNQNNQNSYQPQQLNSVSSASSIYMSTTTISTLVTINQSQIESISNQNDVKSVNNSDLINELNDSSSIQLSSSSLVSSNLYKLNKQLIHKVLLSSQTNVNLIHEILRNAYFLNFDDNSQTIKLVLDAYKKWFLSETKCPSFMLEPEQNTEHDSINTDIQSTDSYLSDDLLLNAPRTSSVSSSNSIILQTENLNNTKIGYIKSLQIFFYHSSSLLLNRSYLQRADKIKNICCYLLDIYKQFIKKIFMDNYTWTMLIKILLKVCNFLFSLNSEYRIDQSAIVQLIKLTTETTLIAMIKSMYNFNVPNELWDQLLSLFQMVNSNSDVVDKWLESIDDLIKQIFKYFYQIDLSSSINSNQLLSINDQTSNDPNNSNNQRKLKQKRNQTNVSSLAQASSNSGSSNYLLTSVNQKINSPKLSQQTNQIQNQSGSKNSVNNLNNNSVLNRQPSTKHILQNTFRDDTYLHTLGNLQIVANEMDQAKSPSLSDEHFINLNNNCKKNANNSSKISSNYGGSNTTGDYTADESSADIDDEMLNDNNSIMTENNMDFQDDDAFDKSSTLKANQQLANDDNNDYNDSDSFDKSNKTNTLTTINRFNSDKSIYYSSEVLVDQNQQSNNSNNTNNNNNSHLDDSSSNNEYNDISSTNDSSNNSSSTNNNNSLTLLTSLNSPSNNNSAPPPLPSNPPPTINLKQYSPKSPPTPNKSSSSSTTSSSNPNQNNNPSSIPPPLPPLPANLPSIFYKLNQQQIQSKSTQLDSTTDSSNNNNNKSIINTSEAINNKINIDTDLINNSDISSNTSSVQASPASKLNENLNQLTPGVEFNLSINSNASFQSIDSANLIQQQQQQSQQLQQSSNTTLTRNDERSASFIMDNNQKYLNINKTSESAKSVNQSLLSISTNQAQNKNRQSLISKQPIQPAKSQLEPSENDLYNKKQTSLLLLKRLFGLMGNINQIKDPVIHKKILEFILTKWDKLSKIKDDFKYLNTNNSSIKLCELIMPQSYFSPWLFESVYKYFDPSASFSPNYQMGILIAYKILCNIIIRSSLALKQADDQNDDLNKDFYSITNEFLDLFYISIHYGLRSYDKNVINCIIQACNTKYWHLMLESSSLLIKDFIDACASIDLQGPKFEAASILGSFICLPDYFGDNLTLLTSNNKNDTEVSSLNVIVYKKEEFKNLLIQSICNFETPSPNSLQDFTNTINSRCVILCSLTCFIYDEIISSSLNQKNWNTQRLSECCKRIFKDLDFTQYNPLLVKMSCDNLRFLSCLANLIFQKEIQFAINIINELNQCLVKLINNKPAQINEDYEKAIISNMFALLEWCMNMPLEQLKEQDRTTLLKNNFKLIIHICSTFKQSESIESEHIHLAAKFIISHLLNQLNHYPFGTYGPTKICSSCNETSDLNLNSSENNNLINDDLSQVLFEQPNIQFFTVNNQYLISFIELSMKNNEKYFNNLNQKVKLSSTACRFIIRDFSGKYSWDCCLLNSPDDYLPNKYVLDIPDKNQNSNLTTTEKELNENLVDFDFKQLTNLNYEQIPKNIDILENLLEYINFSSPECRINSLSNLPSCFINGNLQQQKLNLHWDLNNQVFSNLEDVKQKLLNQYTQEQQYCETQYITDINQQINQIQTNHTSNSTQLYTPDLNSYFHLCKSFVHQMGLLSWEKRQSFNLLHKSPQLLRELKSLDDQMCRETHKIALIYIAPGQEDRQSILCNEKGSKDYEDFLSALAWPINLETHEGFMGGLQRVSNHIKTAPYYSNSTCEVLFHVSTQMNNQNDQNNIGKWRHLGNDSVQIIWSEHSKDYDRSILATEFADVIICIYPLKNGLFRIQIIKKHSVGFFGPLFDGAILHKNIMAHLIRATAINASRVLLSSTKGYQDFYVHRAHAISNIINKLSEKQTFEQFIVDIYSPNNSLTNNVNSNLKIKENKQNETATNMATSLNANLSDSNNLLINTVGDKQINI